MNLFNWKSNDNSNSVELARSVAALNACHSGMMIADRDRNIVFVNDAVQQLLIEKEADIRKDLPHFSAQNLVGQNIDQFHANPNHQRSMLAGMTQQTESQIVVGGINFKLIVTPYFDDQGLIAGHVVEWADQTEFNRQKEMLAALDRSQGVIEFDPQGNIITANDNFLKVVGYSLNEIQGKHHRMFATPELAASNEYRVFWENLRKGEHESGEYYRVGRDGKDIWLQASYNPVIDSKGNVTRVVKYATDITEEKQKAAYFSGQIEAISKSQAVIEFNPDGTIITANDNFCGAVEYRLDEIKGKHHSMFVDPELRSSTEYRLFWEALARGEFQTGEYKRITKSGKDLWIQATYSPILDQNGNVFRVVKYATDITGTKNAVNDICEVMLQLSDGKLNTRLEGQYDEEFGTLADAINKFVDNLGNMIADIRTASETINTAATEIAQGNSDLSTRTEQQASSLEETASSMEELTSTVQHNANNSKQANSLATDAVKVAQNGGDLIEQVVSTMSGINDSAKKIADIIGVIDGIAFQTNILALNAAVEAARAGEQGRGFAVVASEVRTLAQRSANAAKDIKELISDSVNKIESGNMLVSQSGETMSEIVVSIKRVNDIMSEIASASVEQASGIDEVNRAVTQMDEVTQQNAALVEEAAAASESMKTQATQLFNNVSTFELDDSHGVSRAPAPVVHHAPAARVVTPMTSRQPAQPPVSPEEDEWESF